MRLKKIKLAGFKSFVDPTTIEMPSNLIGVVGPNGCGKSNIIDAARWVMGETSAKNLRGENMADVIFSGSTSRKPVGKASVELVFDNTDGTAPGPYAQYAEISVRREVARDGQSDYFLNKTRCRRKDITDLFLGTGLGPRAYAIIEQGMITRIVEGRPEDMRMFVEEAAGISKYKDRRRETENRIRHTQENLERVEDIRQELATQLQRLQRQSKAAARYKELKQQERTVHAQLMTLRWEELNEHIRSEDATLAKLETELEAKRAEQRGIEAEIERLRQGRTESLDHLNKVQEEFYRLGGEIASVEQAIEHARETYQQRLQEREQLDQAMGDARRHLDADRERSESLAQRIANSGPALEQANRQWEESSAALAQAEATMQSWQAKWEAFGQEANESGQVREVQHARIRQFEENIDRLAERHGRLTQEAQTLAAELDTRELTALREQAAMLDGQCDSLTATVEELEARIRGGRREIDEAGHELEDLSGRCQGLEARLASLEELQAAAMGANDQALNAWLVERGLDQAPRLDAMVEVEAGWERALDRVLGGAAGAVCVPALNDVADATQSLERGDLFLVEQGAFAPAPAGDPPTLLGKVRATEVDLSGLLGGIYIADDLVHAMSLRSGLNARESVVTPDGAWVGRNWISLVDQEGAKTGVLARSREIDSLREETAAMTAELEQRRVALAASQESLESLELDRDQNRQALTTRGQERSAVQTQVGRLEARTTQLESRRAQVDKELEELAAQLARQEQELGTSRQLLEDAENRVGEFDQQRAALQNERGQLGQRLEQAREAVNTARDARHTEELKRQEQQALLASTEESIRRLETQVQNFSARYTELEQVLSQGERPEQELRETLAGMLAARVEAEGRLSSARQQVTEQENTLREREQARAAQEHKIQEVRELLEQGRMARKELDVRRETLVEQVREMGFEPEPVFAELPDDANEDKWRAQLESLERKISRIGPVNLVAIEEFEEQSERKQYLDKQHEDLSSALTTLEDAMRKIDRETRTRFKETFDRINTGFQEFFPRLFGGGHAYLELTDDDLLSAGVALMARPPGKRNSTIHLLSGGEKSLTAVALMFSFFELNPAPFCMLDEVDAPLDDANVERYCETLRALSQRSQMIFITHNKISMETADILVGVTMVEPGVSGLVEVDVVQAVELAAQ